MNNEHKKELVALIDQFQKDLSPLHEEVVAARDSAQQALEKMGELRNELTQRSIAILRG